MPETDTDQSTEPQPEPEVTIVTETVTANEIQERLIGLQQSTADILNRLSEIESVLHERISTEPIGTDHEPEPEPTGTGNTPDNQTETRPTPEGTEPIIKPRRKHWYFRTLW